MLYTYILSLSLLLPYTICSSPRRQQQRLRRLYACRITSTIATASGTSDCHRHLFHFSGKSPPPPPPKEKNQPCILPPLLPKQRTRTLIVPPGTTSAAISCSSLSSEPDRMLAISKMMSDTCIERGAKCPSETRSLFLRLLLFYFFSFRKEDMYTR